jgi:hypothetical protein
MMWGDAVERAAAERFTSIWSPEAVKTGGGGRAGRIHLGIWPMPEVILIFGSSLP